MNAYVMTADGVHVMEDACRLEVRPDEVVLIHGDDRGGRPIAAAKLSDHLWVALGERPPARWQSPSPPPVEAPAVAAAEGGWPPEPPPDVDSEG